MKKGAFVWGFKSRAEKLGESYREKVGLSIFDPLDAFNLAGHLDVPIFTVDEAFEDNRLHPHYKVMSDPSRFSAVWMINEDREKIIIHNPHHSKNRQQSDLMHELAHIILGHGMPDHCAALCAEFNMHYYNTQQENEAKFLGACLQITKPGLLFHLKQNKSFEEISEHYCASLEMVNYRYGISGVKNIKARQLS